MCFGVVELPVLECVLPGCKTHDASLSITPRPSEAEEQACLEGPPVVGEADHAALAMASSNPPAAFFVARPLPRRFWGRARFWPLATPPLSRAIAVCSLGSMLPNLRASQFMCGHTAAPDRKGVAAIKICDGGVFPWGVRPRGGGSGKKWCH